MPFDFTVTYISNSGFILEHDSRALVFDDEGKHGGIVEKRLAICEKRPVFFASHSHGDHFSKAIFGYKSPLQPMFIFSEDIRAECAQCVFISQGGSVSVDGIIVTAHGSTDLGVSFMLDWNGTRIFHAGDFNLWHWIDESTPDEIRDARYAFNEILATIKKPIDIAFFPVDPRQGTGYDEGALEFINMLRPSVFIPMHFRDSKLAALDFAAANTTPLTKVIPLVSTGEQYTGGLK